MQQYLPFTVLKRVEPVTYLHPKLEVATVLTVYGIETLKAGLMLLSSTRVATVLTVYGIETLSCSFLITFLFFSCNSTYRLRY